LRKRPRTPEALSIKEEAPLSSNDAPLGIVLSGGGARAAYQVGALKALVPYFKRSNQPIRVVVGSSIGALNGLLLSAVIKNGYESAIDELDSLWRERTFRNTFKGSPSQAFLRAIRMGVLQYLSPGPKPTETAIFDPSPLRNRLDSVINQYGGLSTEQRDPNLWAVAVMTTIEGSTRKPLLFASTHSPLDSDTLRGASFEISYVENMTAQHGFASAALPSVLPPVELDTERGRVRLVDGGISQNIPVDPAARLGAERVIVVDVSGRNWWLDHFNEAHDTRPSWEVPADFETFCVRPPETFVSRCQHGLGTLLRSVANKSTKQFISAVGPTWPVFQLLKRKLGEEVAYEAMTYVALDPDYIQGLIELGYNETRSLLRARDEIEFSQKSSYAETITTI
jgi:predicted acylesterase/phospholipase RssA